MNQNQKHVLLVDDDPISLKYEACILNRVGYVVSQATNGIQAFDQLKNSETPIDLLVTDISMPERNGIELIQDVTAAKKNIPIIVITGKSLKYENILRNDFGITDIIHKPISHHALLSSVGLFLRDYRPR